MAIIVWTLLYVLIKTPLPMSSGCTRTNAYGSTKSCGKHCLGNLCDVKIECRFLRIRRRICDSSGLYYYDDDFTCPCPVLVQKQSSRRVFSRPLDYDCYLIMASCHPCCTCHILPSINMRQHVVYQAAAVQDGGKLRRRHLQELSVQRHSCPLQEETGAHGNHRPKHHVKMRIPNCG